MRIARTESRFACTASSGVAGPIVQFLCVTSAHRVAPLPSPRGFGKRSRTTRIFFRKVRRILRATSVGNDNSWPDTSAGTEAASRLRRHRERFAP